MGKKGYGNVSPRFAKYFARHKNSAGAHDPKNVKQQEIAAAKLTELSQELELYDEDNCPLCGKRLTVSRVWNPIVGEVCSLECLEQYWRGNQEDRDA